MLSSVAVGCRSGVWMCASKQMVWRVQQGKQEWVIFVQTSAAVEAAVWAGSYEIGEVGSKPDPGRFM